MSKPVPSIAGQKFGRLTAISEQPLKVFRTASVRQWLCLCDCGAEVTVLQTCLRRGTTRSCGCLAREMKTNRLIHGASATREFAIYRGILARCRNPNVKAYPRYGGRGIECRWQSFQAFIADMGPAPTNKHEIDRIDTDGHYGPGNCRWATRQEQVNNRRNTRYVEYRGQRMALTDAVRLAGSIIHWQAAWNRIQRGASVAWAVETPPLFPAHNSNRHVQPAPKKREAEAA